MKKILLSLAVLGGALTANAQELPMPSPASKLEQRVGLTDITIEYSRPSMKEREIFGGLVPYGKLWRTGANMNTTIEFSTPVKIYENSLEPGKYSVFTIPEEDTWTIIFNKKTDHPGTMGYTEDNDFLRTEGQVTKVESPVETFTIGINDIRTESATLTFQWANTLVKVPFSVEVKSLAKSNIEEALASSEEKWRVYRNAANYYHNNDMEAEKALEYINNSIDEKDDSWYSYWLKAEILAAKEDYKGAVKAAKESKKVGMKSAEETGDEFGYTGMIEEGIAKWNDMK